MDRLIADLVPDGVVAVETFDDARSGVLFPAEQAIIGTAPPERRREFATGRWCARTALARLGYPPAPVLPGVRGAPVWPAGVVGSITHCPGYRAAVVARASAVAALGVDAEPNAPLPPGVLTTVAGDEERDRVVELLRADPAVCWDRLLFSAKESVYKAWSPLTGGWLDHPDVSIMIDPVGGRFTAGVRGGDGPLTGEVGAPGALVGRWLVRRDLVVTAVTLHRFPACAGRRSPPPVPAARNLTHSLHCP